MKPFPSRCLTRPERIFNYRLSRARRTVENAFGILANRFRVFHIAICLQPDNAESAAIAACILYNIIRNRKLANAAIGESENPTTHEYVQGLWRSDPVLGQQLPLRLGRNNT